jgi:NifU-like protein involved in Fe-S cluster formation
VSPRLSVNELFERGFRRNRQTPLAIQGEECAGADDNRARFSFAIIDGRIESASFRASCCATLIAYCEYLAEIAPGFSLTIARELTAQNLADAVPGVPALKRDRAVLAIAAFRSAVLAAEADTSTPSCAGLTRASRLGAQSPS